MRLLVDIGNTRIKWLCVQTQEAEIISCEQPSAAVNHDGIFSSAIQDCFSKGGVFSQNYANQRIDSVWVSNVAGKQAEKALVDFAKHHWDVAPYFAQVQRNQCGIKNSYAKLSELGVDRWLAIIGAREVFSNGGIIIVNCGTAITVDWLDEENCFQGGAILPGFELASKALSQADGISHVSAQANDVVLGNRTYECVQLGISAACVGGIEKIVSNIQKQYTKADFTILISGGAAPLLQKAWDYESGFIDASSIEYKYDANVVMRGLSRIIECES